MDGTSNYVSEQSRATNSIRSWNVPTTIWATARFSFNYYSNWREEKRFDWGGVVNGQVTSGQDLFNINQGGSLEDVVTLSPTSLLDLRFGATKMDAPVAPAGIGSDPASLGFPAAVTDLFRGPKYEVPFDLTGFTRLQHNTNTNLNRSMLSNNISFQPRFTKVIEAHTINAGWDFRVYRENWQSRGQCRGQLCFQYHLYQGEPIAPRVYQGQGFGSSALGQPTSGQIDRDGTRANQGLFHGLYVQDDWKASSRLTLNLGLRWEYEGPTTERYNQNTSGFDLTQLPARYRRLRCRPLPLLFPRASPFPMEPP